MTKHNVTVTMPVEISFTIDDRVKSDWDGRDLLHIHENGERWATGKPITRDMATAVIAAQIIDRGRLGNTDGFADFPESVTTNSWPHFIVDQADVTVTEAS